MTKDYSIYKSLFVNLECPIFFSFDGEQQLLLHYSWGKYPKLTHLYDLRPMAQKVLSPQKSSNKNALFA